MPADRSVKTDTQLQGETVVAQPGWLSMKRFAIIVAIFGAAGAAQAAADAEVVREMARRTTLTPDEIRRDHAACDSGVTLRMKICASYQFFAQEVRLNRLYALAERQARDAGYEKSLTKAHRNWLAYREAGCEYEAGMEAGGGTAHGLYLLSCRADLTKQRADRLHEQLRQ